ncbi:MAG: ATP-grasp domain-containing protein [Oxalobacteraceae bacterium]|jgi:acetyl/propionyl-CoA carboxylase alpha subunit|nr:MAG: ATP-grasp domain-containing protein [Oxalobacteraceae bacterium]
MKKILVANRGEIACRIIRSCRSLGLSTLAVYSEADRGSLHAQSADEAVAIGPAPARESYLDMQRLLAAARDHGADAVHPGYGFLSESVDFAQAVIDAGLVWIGPRPEAIRDMGDKQRARELARASGLPILTGSPRFATGALDGLEAAGADVGYPLLVKAAAGGGGIGMRRVESAQQLRPMAQATQSMASSAFGDGAIYLERYIERARHVEIQVFGFGNGQAIHLYERDCSTQRRFQKVIEESPAPLLPDEVRERMAQAATKLCADQAYDGAGTVEFVVDSDSHEFFFLEMNTRIQVEHPVTEMNTGFDLVAMQIRHALGTLPPLSQAEVHTHGHAIECRIYAENPAKNFLPSPGKLQRFVLPQENESVRIDSGFRAGDVISHFYDPMIAKIICHAASRDEAIDLALETLARVEIEGPVTNLAFLRATLAHAGFRQGQVFTGFIDHFKQDLLLH